MRQKSLMRSCLQTYEYNYF